MSYALMKSKVLEFAQMFEIILAAQLRSVTTTIVGVLQLDAPLAATAAAFLRVSVHAVSLSRSKTETRSSTSSPTIQGGASPRGPGLG